MKQPGNLYLCDMKNPLSGDTICALATPAGIGALAVIRLSGKDSFKIGAAVFKTRKGKSIEFDGIKGYTLHFGNLLNGVELIDEVLMSVFRNPHSYTGEDLLEFSCHGSIFIQQQILQLLVKQGARLAEPGEFTQRAFLNGKMDLCQAEAVADLISSSHATAHKAALQQLRGGYGSLIASLRSQLIDFASLLELELDFAEEDVEFANRDKLRELITTLLQEIRTLRESFNVGNAMKEGIPIVIAGRPNTGKSTLLNALLNDERAIVSSIAGTTRDVIEDALVIHGRKFRFMDTAGLRVSDDTIEQIGVEKTYAHAARSTICLYLCDPLQSSVPELKHELSNFQKRIGIEVKTIPVINKIDAVTSSVIEEYRTEFSDAIFISAKNQQHLDTLKDRLVGEVAIHSGDSMLVTNARHAVALAAAQEDLERLLNGIDTSLSTDLLAFECRQALHHLGEITGQIYTEDLLGNIFSKFCIGK
jgi:tRNA modification GTPase